MVKSKNRFEKKRVLLYTKVDLLSRPICRLALPGRIHPRHGCSNLVYVCTYTHDSDRAGITHCVAYNMRRTTRLFTLTTILSSLLAASLSAQHRPATVITGATLIDGTGSPPITDAAVIMQGDRITRVGTSSSISSPRGARLIDARGKFLLPGFIDTHLRLESRCPSQPPYQ